MSNQFSRRVDRRLRKRDKSQAAIARAAIVETLEDRICLAATIGVNATSDVHAISPLIYGASFASATDISTLKLTSDRDGGNASDTYNYLQDATNHGSDWYYESIGNGGTNGADMDSFIANAQGAGAAPIMTMDIMAYAASLGPNGSDSGSYPVSAYGAQQSTDPYNSNFGNGVTTGGANILDTNPTLNYVANSPAFQQAWLQHLINTSGSASNGGVQYFAMGNEPSLWSDTHRDLHPNPETNTELINDIISYASMIKSIDPAAQIVGPEEWGWLNYFVDAAGNSGPGGIPVEAALLQAMQLYQNQHGVRLLDYFSNHIYPQASNVFSTATDQATELLRNATTRDLWDPSYVDPSWIGQNDIDGGIIDLIPTMKNWVNTYYPGTKTAITEYNWGADGDMNGATAQADLYGIFGAQGLDMADRWGVPAAGTPTYMAMQLWRNYDGNGSGFGNTSVGATVADPDDTDAFAAIRSSDGALTVAVINKNLYSSSNPTGTTSVTINLSNFNSNGIAQEWQLAAINPSNQTQAAITHLSNINFSGNSITVNVPMESVSMFVIEPATGAPAAPTGLSTNPGNAQVMLSWNPSGGATSYNIYRATASGAETLFKTGITLTSYTDSGLTNGTTYYYQVTATNGTESGKSGEKFATPAAPIANNDYYSTGENTTLTIAPSGVLANDTDASGLTFTASLLSSTADGTLVFDVNGDGGFKYTPKTGFAGTDTFTYKFTDSDSQVSNTATVTLTVNAALPTATNDSYGVNENSTLTIAPAGVLANDTAPAGESLTASLVSGPADGVLTLDANGDGGFKYVPNSGYSGTDSFVYKAMDTHGLTANATVSLSVSAVGTLPPPWTAVSIGSQSIAGSASYSNGTFSVSGSGADIYGTADGFEFVDQALAADGTIIARLDSQQNTNSSAKSGVMIRATTDPASPFAAVFMTPGGAYFEYRTTQGGTVSYFGADKVSVPQYLEVVRAGNSFSGLVSSDGTHWTQIGSAVALNFTGSALAGLVVCSHNQSLAGTATFDNVSLSTATVTSSPVPPPWSANSVGSQSIAGSASYSNGTFSVSGSGADVYGTADGFEFVDQALAADGTIIARIDSQQNTNATAKSGVMIRATTDPASPFAAVFMTPGGAYFEYRTTQGGTVSYFGAAKASTPQYLEVTRTGSSFSGFISTNGVTWTQIGSAVALNFTGSALAGLAVCSHNQSEAGTSTFDNVSLNISTVTPVPPPWTATSVGSQSIAGSASYSSGTFSVSGSGADIYGTADGFEFVNQSLAANGSIIARIDSQQNTNSSAKSGVMIRATTDPASPFAAVFLTPGGAYFEYRTTQGGTVSYFPVAKASAPVYLKVTRSGNSFSGWISTDGVNWTQIGTAITLNFAGSALAGLAVSSHNQSQAGTSLFDQVSLTTS